MEAWEKTVKGLAMVMGGLAAYVGGWTAPVAILVVVMAVDYVSGLLVAWRGASPKTKSGGISSKAGFDGLARKAIILLVVLLATMLDQAIDAEIMMFQTAAVFYYIANEGISILENAALVGVPVPERLKQALDLLKQKSERDQEKKKDDEV